MANMMNVAKNSAIPSWQQELQSAFTDVNELLAFLELKTDRLDDYYNAAQDFPLLVTLSYAERIKKADWNDPLLRQVLPHPDELTSHPQYLSDPVGDANASVSPGLIHKYHGRVLLITTGACAIHCRYCFRREFPYSNNSAHPSKIDSIKEYLSKNPDVNEVILSGGDPLTLNDTKLSRLFEFLSSNTQIERIRIHTRLPIVLPSRITDQLLNTLASVNQKVIMVIHANHPNELNTDVYEALASLKDINVTLLNQTVLLKGVNDHADTLIKLSNRLFECHTLPYYLHLLDKVNGALHFDSTLQHAKKVYALVQTKLPGYLVPKLVHEEAGEPNKTLLQLNL
ncbi:MAG: EF-P beta-lysylation protein EpmB [Cycloclasticus sp. symbiont of Bathymodiolus heckerae]|nr:MAG: EF-P beta-lysylation protein EpmB [Cycloclasticus sp. symbiont of Bathymodiolus heckerae]